MARCNVHKPLGTWLARLMSMLSLALLFGRSSAFEDAVLPKPDDAGAKFDPSSGKGMKQVPLDKLTTLDDDRSGHGRVLQERPLAATFETLPWKAPVISIAMTQIPTAGARKRKYFMYWRAHSRTAANSAATVDLDTQKVVFVRTTFDQFCNGPIVLPDGSTALFGGYDQGNLVQADGRRLISVYDDEKQRLSYLSNMTFSRWYPTPVVTADNKVLIVGGTAVPDKEPQIPVAEVWDPRVPRGPTAPVPLPPTFKASAGLNWYPFMALLPGGEMLWWGDRGGSITDSMWNELRALPPLPSSFPFRTMYPYTSSIVLHALRPGKDGAVRRFSFSIFGGAHPNASSTSPASSLSARLDMYYCGNNICDDGWVIENMLDQPRVMATTTVLPNGKVYIHAGGQAGLAGWKSGKNGYKSILPASRDVVYDPEAPLGRRYSLTDTVGIIRMYHAASCLDLSGKVLSSGCETCGMTGKQANLPKSVSRSPDGDLDFRMSFAVPYEIAPPVTRPVIVSAPKTFRRGSTFTVTYSNGPITGATLVAPCANTHSINMNQRVIFLNIVSDRGGRGTFRAPPSSQRAAAHRGYYMLFLLGADTATGKTYSEGYWIDLRD